MKGKHRCAMPFHHMAIRPDGKIFPCCNFRWESVPEDLNVSHPDPFNHPFLEDLREKMRNDEYVDGCRSCYEDEKNGLFSMRMDVNTGIFWNFPEPRGEEKILTNLDMAFSNLCNNKCRICMPSLSTHWYSDAKKMGYNFDEKGVIAKNNITDNMDVSNITFLKLIGGEPLMEQDKFIDLLEKCDRSKLSVLMTTNATLKPSNRLFELLAECGRVTISLSIDSYGKMNEFIRKDSKWETTVEIINWWIDNTKSLNNIDIGVHSVVSIYNIFDFMKLHNMLNDMSVYHKVVNVDGPNWIMPRNLPEEIKDWACKKLDDLKELAENKFLRSFIDSIKIEIQTPGDFGMFIRNDIRLNRIRNEHWKDIEPELWNKIVPYIKEDILESNQIDFLDEI